MSYTSLIADLDAYTGRSSSTSTNWTTARKESFIELAEAMLERDLHIREMESATTLTANSLETALPNDFRVLRAISINDVQNPEITYLPPAQMRDNRLFFNGQTIEFWSIEGSNLLLISPPSSNVTVNITYSAGLAPLTSSNDDNVLSSRYPDVYLNAALYQAFLFIGDAARAAEHLELYTSAIQDILVQDRRSRRAGGPLRRTVKGAV